MLQIWNKTDNLVLADGKRRTPEEVYNEPGFGWARYADTVLIDVQGGITVAIENLAILCDIYGIDTKLSAKDALAAILDAKQLQKQAMENPSDTERIAAALEFANLLNM